MSRASGPAGRSADAGIVLAGQVLGLGLSFIAGLLAARVFDPALRGEYAMLTTASAFVSVLASFGFAEAIIYFYRRGEADVRRTATSIVLVNGAVTLLTLAVAFPLCPWLSSRFFTTGGLTAAWVAVGAGALGIVVRNGLVFLQARGDFLRSSIGGLLQPAIFALSLALIAGYGGRFELTVGMFLLSFLVPALLLLVPLIRQAAPEALDRAYLGRVARFSAKSYSNVALGQLNYRLDIFVVGALLADLARVADYHIASTLAGLIWIAPDAYATALYPRLAGLPTERERSAEIVSAIRIVLFPVVALAAGLAIAAPLFVPFVFGDRYDGAVPLTWLLLPGVVCMSVNKLLSRYFLSSNRQQIAALAMAAGVAVDLPMLVLLIPRWGVAAASVAASTAYLASLAVSGGAFLLGAELRREDFRGFPEREIRWYRDAAREAWQRLRTGRGPKLPGPGIER